jgi:hypothetical protein
LDLTQAFKFSQVLVRLFDRFFKPWLMLYAEWLLTRRAYGQKEIFLKQGKINS